MTSHVEESRVEVTPTQALAEFAAGMKFDAIPEAAREKVKHLLVDSVACSLAADFSDEVPGYAAFARTLGGGGDTTVIGSADRLSVLGATLLNAYLITAVTVCDVYVPGHVHVSPEVVPPALAIAQRDANDGRSLLMALALGAEVTVRLADAIDYPTARTMGWHLPGIVGPYGAAAAVGRLRGFSTDRFRNAFGLAGSQSAGTWASWGTPAVKFHQSRGAVSGLTAALLAEQDFQASADVIGNPDGGLLTAYSGGGNVEAGLAELGHRWQLEQISLRLWPAGTPHQPFLTALTELQRREQLRWDAVNRVKIAAAPRIYDTHTRFMQPQGFFEAAQSYQFIATVLLRDGYYGLDRIRPEHFGDPDVNAFMREHVDFVPDEAVAADASRVEVTLKTGEVLISEVKAARGAPGNPATRADLEEKFSRCAQGRMDDDSAAELIDLMFRIDELDDLGRLYMLLGAARRRRA
jgi:2-methylcitrate dehydratase PrpD